MSFLCFVCHISNLKIKTSRIWYIIIYFLKIILKRAKGYEQNGVNG